MSGGHSPVDIEAAGWLPADDPLRHALGGHDDEALRARWDEARGEEPALRAALEDVEIPADFEARLLAIPDQRLEGGVRRRWPWLVALVAAVVLLVLARPWAGPAAGEDGQVARGEPAAAVDDHAEPRIVAVKFLHRTCPACEELDPRYADVVQRLEEAPVLFITFDMSTEYSRTQSGLMASALGIRDLYDHRFGSTGYVVLLDAQTREPVGELTTRHDRDEMVRLIEEAVGEVS